MSFDGLFIKKLIEEVKILENRILKSVLYSQDKFYFYFNFEKSLVIDIDKNRSFFYLDEAKKDKNYLNHFFLDYLKKLEQFKLVDISQYETDRTIIFTFHKMDNILGKIERKLILEAMQTYSNLILIDGNNKILSSYKPINLIERNIIDNTFKYYQSNKLSFFKLDINNILNKDDITKKYMGLSKLIANYLFENRKNIGNLEYKPVLYNDLFYFSDIFIESDEKIYFNTLSELLKYKYDKKDNFNQVYKEKLEKEINNFKTRYSNVLKNYEDKEEKLKYKEKADFIYANLDDINLIKKTVELDDLKSLSENAQLYYKEYKKAKQAIEYIEKELVDIKLSINFLELKLEELVYLEKEDRSQFLDELKDYIKLDKNIKIKKEKLNLLVFNINGSKIYVGKNSKQNEYILKNIAKNIDTWFHVKSHAGSHVILKGNLDNNLIHTCSQLALYYSSQRFSNNVEIDYTTFNQVSRVRKAKAYNVIYKKAKTVSQTVDNDFIKSLDVYKELKNYE